MTRQIELLHESLDADPFDYVLRMALADALTDAGEPALAEGYRALAAGKRVPLHNPHAHTEDARWTWGWCLSCYDIGYDSCTTITKDNFTAGYGHFLPGSWARLLPTRSGATRRAAEDAAAAAFAALSSTVKESTLAAFAELTAPGAHHAHGNQD